MSYSLIDALFNGKLIPWERKGSFTPKRRELECKIEREKKYFAKKMSLCDRDRFEELQNLFMQATYEEEIDIYSHGFTLGSHLMMEIMEKKENIINE